MISESLRINVQGDRIDFFLDVGYGFITIVTLYGFLEGIDQPYIMAMFYQCDHCLMGKPVPLFACSNDCDYLRHKYIFVI